MNMSHFSYNSGIVGCFLAVGSALVMWKNNDTNKYWKGLIIQIFMEDILYFIFQRIFVEYPIELDGNRGKNRTTADSTY